MNGLKKDIKKLLNEASEDNSQYNRVKTLLDNNIFNHAELVDKVWGSGAKDDASKRSLFRKKLNREEYQGTKYSFDDQELSKIIQALMDTSTTIKKNLGRKE